MKRTRSAAFWLLVDELIRERTGLTVERIDAAARERLITHAMKRAGDTDELSYVARLKSDAQTFDALVADLTVHETYFFRDPPHFEALREDVLPAIVRARPSAHVLELWSAGCSSGEEPYSLAITLEQLLLAKRARVLGTDVSPRALARAERAIYGKWALRATDPKDVQRYFTPHGREQRLIDRIRARVSFEQRSLTAGPYPRPSTNLAGFDLILCRNVLIYFEAARSAEVGLQLAQSLAPGGFLMMGPSDPRLSLEALCELVPTPHGMLYRRHEAGRQTAPSRNAEAPRLPASSLWSSQRAAPELRTSPALRRDEAAPPPVRARSHDDTTLATVARETPATIEQVQRIAREHGAEAAETACRDLLAREPLSPELQFAHAALLVDLGREEAAEVALRRAIYLDRGLLVAHMLYATLLAQRGERAAGRRVYEQLAIRAGEQPPEQLIPLGEGLTYGAVARIAKQRAHALGQESAS
jgi:chemotaxis protein methyltransferase CheR